MYGVEFRDAEALTVQELEPGDDGAVRLNVGLRYGGAVTTRALIAASGITDQLPDLPGLKPRWGKTALHCPYCHGWEVREQRMGVLALSPMALHHAELLRQWTDTLTFFSAGAGKLDDATQQRLRSRDVVIEPSPVTEILGEPDAAAGMVLENGNTVEVDAIFTLGGAIPHDTYLDELQLERQDTPVASVIKADPATGQTSHPRIWAAGNVAHPMANVPMSISAGTMAGAMANMTLVTEDFDLAERARAV